MGAILIKDGPNDEYANARKKLAKVQVPFAYTLNSLTEEWEFSVIANVYPLNGIDDADGKVEIVSIARHITGVEAKRKGCGFEVCENLPAFILDDIAAMALEKYNDAYCEALNDMG